MTRLRPASRLRRRLVALVALSLAAPIVGTTSAGAAEPLPKISGGLASVIEGNAGTTLIEIPVALSHPTTDVVTAEWTTLFGPGVNPPSPATPGTDFTAANGTVTFTPGNTADTITITVNGDTTPEPDEFIVVALSNPTNATIGGFWGLGFGIIENDDPPRLVPGLATMIEGDTGTTEINIPVSLSVPTVATVTAEWTTLFGPGVNPPSPATPGTDFTAANGTVTFTPGNTADTITITVNGDTTPEPDEFIVVALSNPTNATIGGFWGLGFGIIENDDIPERGLTLVPSTGFDGGDLVTVQGVGWSPGADIALCQAANDPAISPPQDACLSDNTGLAMFSSDGFGEFSVQVEARRWGFVPGLGAWIDCTAASPGCVIGAAEVDDVGSTLIVAPLEFATPPAPPATPGAVTVSPVVGGTAQVAGSGFRPNERIDLHQCMIEPVSDGPTGCDWASRVQTSTDGAGAFSTTLEVDTFLQGVDCRTGACRLAVSEAVDFEGTVVVEPIAFAPPTVVPGDVSMLEGDTGDQSFVVPVTLSEPTNEIVTVDWATTLVGSPQPEATPGEDYTQASGTVTFLPEEVDAEVVITVSGDLDPEPDEVVWIRFSDPVNATVGPDDLGGATIEDDDNTLPVLAPCYDILSEPEHVPAFDANLCFNLEPTSETVSARWETLVLGPAAPLPDVQEATPGEDYLPAAGTVSYPPGGPVGGDNVITLLDDSSVEPVEIIWIRFFDPTNAVLGGDSCTPIGGAGGGCVVGLYIDQSSED